MFPNPILSFTPPRHTCTCFPTRLFRPFASPNLIEHCLSSQHSWGVFSNPHLSFPHLTIYFTPWRVYVYRLNKFHPRPYKASSRVFSPTRSSVHPFSPHKRFTVRVFQPTHCVHSLASPNQDQFTLGARVWYATRYYQFNYLASNTIQSLHKLDYKTTRAHLANLTFPFPRLLAKPTANCARLPTHIFRSPACSHPQLPCWCCTKTHNLFIPAASSYNTHCYCCC